MVDGRVERIGGGTARWPAIVYAVPSPRACRRSAQRTNSLHVYSSRGMVRSANRRPVNGDCGQHPIARQCAVPPPARSSHLRALRPGRRDPPAPLLPRAAAVGVRAGPLNSPGDHFAWFGTYDSRQGTIALPSSEGEDAETRPPRKASGRLKNTSRWASNVHFRAV